MRTVRHPAVGALGDGVATCDDLYEAAETMDDVYAAIVERVVDVAAEHGEVALPRARLAARRRADGRTAADARRHRSAGRSVRVVSRPVLGPAGCRPRAGRRAHRRRAPFRDRSGRRARPVAGRAVRLAARALRYQAQRRRRSRGRRAPAPRFAGRGRRDGRLGRSRPLRRARPPHVSLDPRAGRADQR